MSFIKNKKSDLLDIFSVILLNPLKVKISSQSLGMTPGMII